MLPEQRLKCNGLSVNLLKQQEKYFHFPTIDSWKKYIQTTYGLISRDANRRMSVSQENNIYNELCIFSRFGQDDYQAQLYPVCLSTTLQNIIMTYLYSSPSRKVCVLFLTLLEKNVKNRFSLVIRSLHKDIIKLGCCITTQTTRRRGITTADGHEKSQSVVNVIAR